MTVAPGQRGFLALGAALPGWMAYAAVGVAVLVVVFIIWRTGYAAGKNELTEYQAQQGVATLNLVKVVEKTVTEVQTKYVDRIRTIKVKGETIIKEVPVYVDKSDDAACELRRGFVRLHDSAARNQPPGPATSADRDPAGIALSTATAAIAENYSEYHKCREQVIGWNEFYAKLREQVKGVCAGSQ